MSSQLDELRQKEEDGDVKAMQGVALNLLKGENGYKKDYKAAFGWFDKARVAGDISGLAHTGWMLAMGEGVRQDSRRGLVFMALAAERGSDVEAYWLGHGFADGRYGLAVDPVEAHHWLERSLSNNCTAKNLSETARENAQKRLRLMSSRVSVNKLSVAGSVNQGANERTNEQ